MKRDDTIHTPALLKWELALRYFPDSATKKSATSSLWRMIRRCTPLSQALVQANHHPSDKYFTPRQVRLIYHYLGEP